ncbi:hypothetical protein GW916_09695 [bacterium]|nr:hypothetical protein [bacterium]
MNSLYEGVSGLLDKIVMVLGVSCVGLFILYYGFPLETQIYEVFGYILYGIALVFVFQELLRFLFCPHFINHLKSRKIEVIFILLLMLTLFAEEIISFFVPQQLSNAAIRNLAVGYLAFTQSLIFFTQLVRSIRNSEILSSYELTSSRLMAVSFVLPIAVGTLLLKLPNATVEGISWLDALFTATSAVCVTGLAVVDTQTAFTPFGQALIALLFQVGGLGIMTITMSFGFLFARGMAVRERILFSELLAEERLGQVGRILIQVTLYTLLAEGVGTIVLYISQKGSLTNLDWPLFLSSAFHSISAFCNAGFSLFSEGLYAEQVRSNHLYSYAIMGLIVAGGLGYPVFYNILCVIRDSLTKSRTRRTLVKVQTKMVLITTLVLLVTGTFAIYLMEGNHSFQSLGLFEQIRQSAFLSVTSRTAGFNIWPTESLSFETGLVLMVLMWIGGSPMSTAGGIKTLTFAMAWLNLTAALRGANKIIVFGREIANSSLNKSYAIIFGSILILIGSTGALILMEPDKNHFDLAFEVVSAFGTVGLSRGVTASLSDSGKLLIVALMYAGRLGFLVLLNSLYKRYREPSYKVLKENVQIS